MRVHGRQPRDGHSNHSNVRRFGHRDPGEGRAIDDPSEVNPTPDARTGSRRPEPSSTPHRTDLRTIFVSDVHLGCRHAQTDQLVSFLRAHRPERLYLVGDFIDGWRLRRRWRWTPDCGEVVDAIVDLARTGTDVLYAPGNHDDFLRTETYLHRVLRYFDFLVVREEFLHETADGRRLLVTHGDRFDVFETNAAWVSKIAAWAYDQLLAVNGLVSGWRGHRGAGRYALSAGVKKTVKTFVRFLSGFEDRLLARVAELDCDGAVCGHVHTPTITPRDDGRTYFNTGDWVEHCSALVEYEDGGLELLLWADHAGEVTTRTLAVSPAVDRPVERPRAEPIPVPELV